MNWEELLARFKWQIALILTGLLFVGSGLFILRFKDAGQQPEIEILDSQSQSEEKSAAVVEVSGAVVKPGVYKMSPNARVEDALIAAGGVAADADRAWMDRTLNRAAKLTDGQKLYIPKLNEQSDVLSANNGGGEFGTSVTSTGGQEGLVNINTASQSELEELWGIGPVYAQKIIEYRPYSSVEELLSKDVLQKNIYERNKDLLTIY